MNIIQLQDRLKGLPDETLRKYVEQPMGEAPIYLVLGELQRRNEMKKRFQATEAEKPSVSEQIVAESKPMKMGLGAMAPQRMMPEAQGVGTPPPAPEIDPRQLAASGIATNPQSAVGGPAMMAKGGIVPGFKVGGQFTTDLIKRQAEEKAKNIVEDAAGATGIAGTVSSATDKVKDKPGMLGRVMPFAKRFGIPGAAIYGLYSLFSGDDNDSDLKPPPDKPTAPFTLPNISSKDSKKDLVTTAKEQQKLIEELIGVDTTREDTRARAEKRKEDALNMALIRGGLGMASGQSADFIENLAKGATAGVESFAKTTDEVDEILANIDKQQRAEDVAIATKALDMAAKERELEQELEIAKIASTGQTPGGFYSIKQQNKVAEQLLKDEDYQRHKMIATDLRAKAKERGGLSDDDLAALAKAEAAMRIAEDDVYKAFNMVRPQQTIGDMVTTGGPYNLSEEDQALLNKHLTTE